MHLSSHIFLHFSSLGFNKTSTLVSILKLHYCMVLGKLYLAIQLDICQYICHNMSKDKNLNAGHSCIEKCRKTKSDKIKAKREKNYLIWVLLLIFRQHNHMFPSHIFSSDHRFSQKSARLKHFSNFIFLLAALCGQERPRQYLTVWNSNQINPVDLS